MKKLILSSAFATLLFFNPNNVYADPGAMTGSGNFYLNDASANAKIDIMNKVGAKIVRVPIHPPQYWKGKNPNNPKPEAFDDLFLNAYNNGIVPMLIFAHNGKSASIGTYENWYKTGKAFAERFAPNSPWLLSQGIRGWGIEIYSAINEPGGTGFPIKGTQSYYKLLEGLADGVHSVNPKLQVIPGGLRGRGDAFDTYLKAIAPLFNKGKLDGLDLHRYVNLHQSKNPSLWSAQSIFEKAKNQAGITADINYYTTEFNVHGAQMSDPEAGKIFLTMFWDQLGVVKNSGAGATKLSMPWSLFGRSIDDKNYGLVDSRSLDSWKPETRAKVLKLALDLSEGMKFIHRDPKKKGLYVLKVPGKSPRKLYVWQNLDKWTNSPGETHKLTNISKSATTLKVYNWNGLQKTYPLSQQNSYIVRDLVPQQTYMFLVE